MLSDIKPGDAHTLEREVTAELCTERGAYRIFSTPDLVLLLEAAAIDLLAPHLGEDQSSVGSRVEIAHSAPTLLGQRVSITATVTEVDRRRVAFAIEAHDGVDAIGSGTHERFVVDLDKFGARLAEKEAAVAG
jgi:fluoroacetyl-CoA thioesterase